MLELQLRSKFPPTSAYHGTSQLLATSIKNVAVTGAVQLNLHRKTFSFFFSDEGGRGVTYA